MTDSLYTQKVFAQFRGPSTSDSYNERIENLYKDLMTIINRQGLLEEDNRLFYQRMLKELFYQARALTDLETRVQAVEDGDFLYTFTSSQQIDIDRFTDTDFAITADARATWDGNYGIFTLPRIDASSVSKLKLNNEDGKTVIPSTFEALVNGVEGTADSLSATLDTSDVYNAVLDEVGAIWERNVLVSSPNPNGAEMILWVRFPTDISTNENTNCIILHPFPSTAIDILDVQYSTDPDIVLNSTDNFVSLNNNDKYDSNQRAIGWVPPGGWSGDTMINAGPKIFYFDPLQVTGLKITFRQKNFFIENSKYIYAYGLSKLDAKYVKFTDTGKTIIRVDAPDGMTINGVNDVLPDIWNVLEAELPNVFSYRVIYETSYNSGVYTLEPVALANRVWIEVTLAKTLNNGTPALSGLKFDLDMAQ